MSRAFNLFCYTAGVATGLALASFRPAIQAAMERVFKTVKKESQKTKKVKFTPKMAEMALSQ